MRSGIHSTSGSLPLDRSKDTSFMVSGKKTEKMGTNAIGLWLSSWMRMFLSNDFYFLKEIREVISYGGVREGTGVEWRKHEIHYFCKWKVN